MGQARRVSVSVQLRETYGVDQIIKTYNADTMSISEASQYLEDGQFPEGSMGPKIEAMLFAKENAHEISVSLCQPGDVIETMRGAAGTTIID